MPDLRARQWQILLAGTAVALGAGLAWLQYSPGDEPPAPDRAEPAAAASGNARLQPPATRAGAPQHATPAAGATAAAPAQDVASGDPARPDAPDPTRPDAAPLPEFFENALGPPQLDADGELVEGSPHELQARLDGERRDDVWADKVEWQLGNFLGLQPFMERVDTTNVICRATVCRITATADRASMPAASEDGWEEMIAALRYETVSNEFAASTNLIVFNVDEPQRIGFVTYFERTRRR